MSHKNNIPEDSAAVMEKGNITDSVEQHIAELEAEIEVLRKQLTVEAEKLSDLDKKKSDLEIREAQLILEKEQVKNKQEELSTREKVIRTKELALKEQSDKNEADKEWIKQKQTELSASVKDITTRTSDLEAREQNAIEGFAKQQADMIKACSDTLNKLEKQISDAQKRAAKAQAEAESKENAVEQEIYKNAKTLSEEILNSANKVKETNDKLYKDLISQKETLAYQTKVKEDELEAVRKRYDDIDELVAKRVEMKYKELNDQLTNANNLVDNLIKENKALRAENTEYQKNQLCANGRSMAELVDSENQKIQEITNLQRQIYQLESNADDTQLREKARRFELIQPQLEELRTKNNELSEQLAMYRNRECQTEVIISEKDSAIYERDAARAQARALGASVHMLEQTVNSLKEMAERPAERDARIRDITGVLFTKKRKDILNVTDEIEWLGGISKKLAESGILINDRLLYAFHTSLKTAEWSPITVLAGVSGTGKSLLPKLYAKYGGMYFLSLAVQPDWDSSQALLGYFNALDNKFNATKLLSAMVQFQDNDDPQSLADSMMLVLLDEMNLAHVELYFSELLSKLEDRRGEKGSVCIDVDLGSGLAKYEVELSRNILWAGTMNEDETTKTLSDKVIDRSNMLSFPTPRSLASRENAGFAESDGRMLPAAQWKKWLENAVKFNDNELIQNYKSVVEDINRCLSTEGRALGHRVWQAIEHYIANHPQCIHESKEPQSDGFKAAVQGAFEEAVVYKIMPKLRGIEITPESKRDCFKPIEEILAKNTPGIVADYNNAIKGDQFVWKTADYLENSSQ